MISVSSVCREACEPSAGPLLPWSWPARVGPGIAISVAALVALSKPTSNRSAFRKALNVSWRSAVPTLVSGLGALGWRREPEAIFGETLYSCITFGNRATCQ